MKKYTIDYVKSNKVAIKVNNEEYQKLIKFLNCKNPERVISFGYAVLFDTSHYDLRIWSDSWFDLIFYKIIDFQTFIEDNKEETFVLPEKWCFTTTEKSHKIFIDWYIDKYKKIRGSFNTTIGNHYCINEKNNTEQGWMYFAPERKEGYTEITFEQFKKYVLKQDDMEKKIIGYKLNGKVDRQTVNRFLGESVPMCGDILLSGKTKHINEMTSEEKSVYFTTGHIGGSLVKKCKEAGVLDLWFEPVYEPEKPKEEIISMGNFSLKVTKEGIFHKTENITEFVKTLTVKFDNRENYAYQFGNYTVKIKEVIFSKTGCESSETTLSQWLKVWDKYQEFQIKLCQHY